jgi:hypothetical protein
MSIPLHSKYWNTSKKNGRFPIQFQTKIIMEFIKVVCEIASTQNNT